MRYIKIIAAVLLVFAILLPLAAVRSGAASSSEREYFLSVIGPMATQNMRETGILASLTIAQGIYESGWGTSFMAKNLNNLFGIKAYAPAWTGKVYNRKTGKIYTDFDDAKKKMGDLYSVYISHFFRVYNSWEESVNDHSRLFTTMSRYENLVGLTDYELACHYVMQDGYCDTPGYDEELISIIKSFKLYKYDVYEGIDSIDMNVDSLVLVPGESVQVYPTVSAAEGVNVYLQYKSSDTSVATVSDEGVITGVKQGPAIITVSTNNGRSDKCLVYVHEPNVVLRSGVITSAVNCRTEPYDTGGSATLIGGFSKGTKIVVFGEAARTQWHLVAGYGTKGELLFGYSYGNYYTIGDEFAGDTPAPYEDTSSQEESSGSPSEEPSEEISEESSEEVSEEISEEISEESSEEISEGSSEESSEETSEEISEESSSPQSEDTGLYIGSVSGDLNCRKGPSLDQSSYGVFAKGSTVLVIGGAVNTRWYQCAGMSKGGKFVEGYAGFKTSDGSITYITVIGNFTDTVDTPLGTDGAYVTGIGEQCTVSALASRMKYASVSVLSPNGTELGANDIITTGCSVSFVWCGKTYLTKTVIIPGDVNCDGKVDASDCAILKKAVLGQATLSGINALAARFTGGETITIDDYTALRLYTAGK